MTGCRAAFRFVARDLRGGLKGFRVMVACLALGVAAIAAIGSLTAAVRDGLARDTRVLLGGDLDVRITQRAATAKQLAWFRAHGKVSTVATMRAMATVPGSAISQGVPDGETSQSAPDGATRRALVELKAVDRAYPLLGHLQLAPAGEVHTVLARKSDGRYGVAVADALLARLNLKLGDTIRIGGATFDIRARVAAEPDMTSGFIQLGPRALITADALDATGLVQPGSLIRWHYRLVLPSDTDPATTEAALNAAFPDAAWRVRTVDEAAPRIQREVDRAALFFTLVGLTALLVGGIGVAGAVKAHLDSRRDVIATLKCLGATGGFVFTAFGAEIAAMAAVGIVAGLTVGAALPLILVPMFGAYLPVTPGFALHPLALSAAAAYGIAVAALFALWPLARARAVPAAALFRGLVADIPFRPRIGTAAALLFTAGAVAALALGTAYRPVFAAWFIAGATIAFISFALAGVGLRRLARRWGRALSGRGRMSPRLQLALGNIARPGAPAQAIVLALGIALTVFVALAQVEGNFQRQITENMPDRAPAYFFIDIQPGQLAGFEKTVHGVPGTGAIETLPSLRGRIAAVNGTPVDKIDVGPGARWAVGSDRGVSYARTPPDNADIVAGSWWPADYKGPPLMSLDAHIAKGLGIGVGDTITVNILGRAITARVANTRKIDWSSLGLNFTMMLSPNAVAGAPHTFIATVAATKAAAVPLVRAVSSRFANVTAISVRETLDMVADAFAKIGWAARATAGLALVAGILVLAGAIAAGRRERTRDAVILKVTGARRRDLAVAYLIEYGLAGLAAAMIAVVLGTAASFFVLTRMMNTEWAFLPGPAVATVIAATAAVIGFGFAGTWRALAQKPAGVLRETAAA